MRQRGEVIATEICACTKGCRNLKVKWDDGEVTDICASSIKPIDTGTIRFKNLINTRFKTLNYSKYQLDHTIR